MNIQATINHWLADLSGGQWQLLNDECNLVGEDGLHFCTIVNCTSQLLAMFPLHPSQQVNSASLHARLLQLNMHPDLVGVAYFSLATDNATVVLNFVLSEQALCIGGLNEFWQNALGLRSALFKVIGE